ncbi:hypothetical protein [Actinomadura madurae]|uniref:hypothetical protein n=1 Tax=Actinomadura madurae TaxID=1993 RepID=UPI0020D25487|nr:hypothetical protein [Actinomadura madurae]MCQ0013304.1 hypothetical protein [Actinomadura madurae]
MSGHDDVPDWAPRNLPEPDDPETPYTFLGASQPGGAPAPHGPGARPAGPEAPFDAFTRPARASRPPGRRTPPPSRPGAGGSPAGDGRRGASAASCSGRSRARSAWCC